MRDYLRLQAIVFLLAVLPAASFAQTKPRVAILDFDYGTVRSGVMAWFNTNVDVGQGIADVLVDKLLKTGKYSIIERKALEKVLAEQNFSNSDRANASTAAKIGKILGVDALIIGSITQFGRDDSKQSYKGGVFGRLNKYGLGGVEQREAKATVAITARMIDTDTAEILASVTGTGSSERGGTSVLGAGGGSITAGGSVDMNNSNFAQTILGEAVHEAAGAVAKQLETQAANIQPEAAVVEGLVADVDSSTLILNIGAESGVKPGDKLLVRRKVREVKDPATGEVIRVVQEDVGHVTLSEVDARSSVGKFSGSGAAQVGDMVGSAQ